MVGADFHLVVSNLILESEDYRRFYQGRLRQGDFVIMDSPAFETRQQTDLQDTLHAAMLLRPSEVVLPDDMNSASRTIEGTSVAFRAFDAVGFAGRYMVVPHGRDLVEFTHCARALL